jgi:transketolase
MVELKKSHRARSFNMSNNTDFQEKAINTIRFLSADCVQEANSGHPGLPMGAAAIAYTIWMRHLRSNPVNPDWANRDRFILSGGHGSMLIYSLLHLTGFNLPLEELKNFRQWESKTPGHPEYRVTPGVETTTGPLGQGFANGVGMAIAEAHLAAEFNQTDQKIVDHYTYAIVTDGDLMEGISSEAASLAGHLKLGKLIYLYDDNKISIEGSTDLAFTEDRGKRFEAYGWHVSYVEDGNDVEAIDKAIQAAKKDDRPSLIVCKTQIGYGLPTKAGTEKAHGEPPGEEELLKAKQNLGWPTDEKFFIPEDVLAHFRDVTSKGESQEKEWDAAFSVYKQSYPEQAAEFERRMAGKLPKDWSKGLKTFPVDEKGTATRNSSGKILNEIAVLLPELMGGSADLAPSTKTWIENSKAFQHASHEGRNLHFGVREHGMGGVVNGMAYHGGFIPYGATFLTFLDYMKPSVRLSALSHLHSIWVFTHDSIGLGEDGPTHQPIEHLMSLRAMPEMTMIRPCDANEVREAWISAIENRDHPTTLIFTRQNVPTLDREKFAKAEGLHKGAYVLADLGQGKPEIILMATGSEVELIIKAGEKLAEEGVNVRLVSFPCWSFFENQSQSYRDAVLDPGVEKRIAVEAGVSLGWEKWVGSNGTIIGVDQYGASAPYEKIFEEYGLTTDQIYKKAKTLLK